MPIYLPELSVTHIAFPPVEQALKEPDGLLAMGGDLSPARLIMAYQHGIFPWFSDEDPLLWWSPSLRAVFPPETLKLNRSLRKYINKTELTFSVNHAFSTVIAECAAPRKKQNGTWILPQMQQAYLNLHQAGIAHSIEVWQQEKLVGGLYGLALGGIFCGESMFNRIPNAAKLALVALQQHLSKYCQGWIDCQLPNPFLLQQGAQPMPRKDYLSLLQQLQQQPAPATHWSPQSLQLTTNHV